MKEREGQFATPAQEEHFASFMESLGLTVYFLSADRRIQSDIFPREDEDENEQLMMFRMGEETVVRRHRARAWHDDRPDDQTRAVLQALELASSWIRGQVLQAANKGTSSSHGIYEEIVKHILTARPQDTQSKRTSQVIDTLRSLATRTSEYARFGFISSAQRR